MNMDTIMTLWCIVNMMLSTDDVPVILTKNLYLFVWKYLY